MVENPAKREEARRVWRLNKKEGVPVLEALETADISKDTYYEYKAEYESEWEGQILTAEEVERELEELRQQISDLMEQADAVEERFDSIGDKFEEIEEAIAAERTASELWELNDEVEHLQWRIQQLESAETAESYADGFREPIDLEELQENVRKLIENQNHIKSRVDDMEEEKLGKDDKRGLRRRIKEVEKKVPESIFDFF